MLTLKNILVATDFSDASTAALAYGREMAQRFDATLHIVHVVDDLSSRIATATEAPVDFGHLQTDLESSADQRLEGLLTDQDRAACHAKVVRLTSTMPARAIGNYAHDSEIDLIVMGTHGRAGVAHLLMGSVAERVVRSAPCPVLTVHN